jgi:BirA family biotin operon repressor/biotin-[acetyl-CoA-carboxylase] ligase
MHLTCAAGVAASDAIYAASGIRPGLKWINDLVIGAKKVGGILAEMSLTPSGDVDYALIGIGINCKNTISPELSQIATSLDKETGKIISPAALAAELLQALYKMSATLLFEKAHIMDQYRQQCVTTSKDVILLRGEEKRTAFALSVTDDGGLLVEFPDKHKEMITSGEASVRGFFGYSS